MNRINKRSAPTARESREDIQTVGFGSKESKKPQTKHINQQQKAQHVLGQPKEGPGEGQGETRIRQSDRNRDRDRDRDRDRKLDRESFNYSPKALKTIINSLDDLQHLNKHPVAPDDGDEPYSPNKAIGAGDTSEYEPEVVVRQL
jgi:hypothetical protein